LETISAVLKDPESDLSFWARREQTNQAWQTFKANPLFGAGPGKVFSWSLPIGYLQDVEFEQTNIDTMLSYLAKFGVLGLAIAAAWFVAMRVTWRRLPLSSRSEPYKAAFIGFLAILLVNLPLANPLEDKGVAFTLLLILTLLVTADETEDQIRDTKERSRP
jgi:O-antigen ligase